MNTSSDSLEAEIERTLRNQVYVPRLNPDGLLARPGFWKKCHAVNPIHSDGIHRVIFVDGFVGASKWNCWKVYSNDIEEGLTIWLGYALGSGKWTEHAWCMLDDRIVETTRYYSNYFGAMLDAEERLFFSEQHGKHSLRNRPNLQVATFVDGWRAYVPYEPAKHWEGIGRERDLKTRKIREGLGRQ